MEILIRSIALAAGVHVPPEVDILPPRRRHRGRPVRAALGRTLKGLGVIASRAGHWLADGADDHVAPAQASSRS